MIPAATDGTLRLGGLALRDHWFDVPLNHAEPSGEILGQSYGGFCILNYLSSAPQGLAAAYLTGGLGPLDATAEDVYRATYDIVRRKNHAYHQAFPGDREHLERVAAYLREHDVRLPDGSPLSVRRFQAIGMALGARMSVPSVHYLLEEAFVSGAGGPELSDTFLHGVHRELTFAARPLYAVLHEPIYAQAAATRWAADRLRPADFDPDASPLLLTGEMIYPWMFHDDPALRPLSAAAELLADRVDWPTLYDRSVLAANEVPAAAVPYTDDMYVDARFSDDTAAAVRGMRVWKTNAYEHDGLRETDDVLDRLIKMARGEL